LSLLPSYAARNKKGCIGKNTTLLPCGSLFRRACNDADWGKTKQSFVKSNCGSDASLHPNIEYVPQFSDYWSLNPAIEDMNTSLIENARFVIGCETSQETT